MASKLSGSKKPSPSFEHLSRPIKKWVWQQGWQTLRDIQERAIPPLLRGGDAIISAPTAGGKTEAAFLPLLSKISTSGAKPGFAILYISPLKALINDQHRRLEGLCDALDIQVTKWHGDVASSVKQKALKKPSGVLLITPESLEALLMRRALFINNLFANTQAIVIDELHAFMGTERGVQLISLQNRIEALTGRPIDRIGLSATLGDMGLAADYLRPGAGKSMPIITSDGNGMALKLQLRGYIEMPEDPEQPDAPPNAEKQVGKHLFETLKGNQNLVFGGSKKNVELYSALLRDMCQEARLPNEFFTHHGNISKADREFLEKRLKQGRLPTTAVCTTTLELGIDIGEVEAIAQIGCSSSVAGLRQRLGRSGRREGKDAILRGYIIEQEVTPQTHPQDRLRSNLVQAMAEVELLLNGWFEPPEKHRLHLSTLVHQILALIVERGGVDAMSLFQVLNRPGPFSNITENLFSSVLRAMGKKEVGLIEQAPDGTILLGERGEKLTSHYRFYAVFETKEEFRVVCKGKELGTLPMLGPTAKDMIIIFSGRRWKILEVYVSEKIIDVTPAHGGRPPKFGGGGPDRHPMIDQKMFEIYQFDDIPAYLDKTAQTLLNEARFNFSKLNLGKSSILPYGEETLIFPWRGSAFNNALGLIFRHAGFRIEIGKLYVSVRGAEIKDFKEIIHTLASGKCPGKIELARVSANLTMGQYDWFLTDDLLVQQLASTLPDSSYFKEWAINVKI